MKKLLRFGFFSFFLISALFAQSDEQRVQEVVSSSLIYTVLPTGSMKPTFDESYLLLVQYQDFRSLKIGDIIVWRSPVGLKFLDGQEHELVVHRVWGISSGHSVLLTKGDNNWQVDSVSVTEDMYVGTVVGIIKKLTP